jgi:uncharacterized protein
LRADRFAQLKLLDLQAVDSTLDKLDRRLTALPENTRLAELSERRVELSGRLGRSQTAVHDLEREQRKADADVEQVKTRRARNTQRIDAGLVSDPKQLQAMQHELVALDRRIGDLEDIELDVMQRLENTQRELESLTAELAQVEQQVSQQEVARDSAVAQITQQRADAAAEREKLVAEIPADLLSLYERLRGQLGGVAVGALYQGRCGGCRLDIGAADLARMATAPSDELLRCEECDRILVRTAESGI